jgi:Nucleotidyltransferase domain
MVRVTDGPAAVRALGERLDDLGWVRDLWVAGSLATGDYVPRVSDLDLVAVVDGSVDKARQETLSTVHRDLDIGVASGLDLGCAYVDETSLDDRAARHPTWTHGLLVDRILSGVARAELARFGYAVTGRDPRSVVPAVTDDDVRAAACDEICGYWAWAARRPDAWLNPVIVDLGLTGMARGRHAIRTGQLLTKSEAIDQAHAPAWLIADLRARRRGEPVVSPRVRSGLIAWRDTRRTVALARSGATR